ncbi:hypothetical protein ACFL24_00765 [Patescibacteria group bacterium]
MKKGTVLKTIILISLIALFLILTNIPHLVAYFKTPEGMNFVGTNGGFPDANTYFAKMLEGQEGKWLYENRFTSEEHKGAFVNTFYVLSGHFAKWFNLSLVAIFQTARIIFGIALCLAIYFLSSLFFKKFAWRMVVLILSLLPLGFGWILRLVGSNLNLPDVYLGEGNNFLSLILYPHFTAAVALMILTFIAIIKIFTSKKSWLWAIGGGLSCLGIALIHPYPIIVIWIMIALIPAMVIIKFKKIELDKLFKLATVAIIPAPLIIYQFYVFRFQAVFKDWALQNTCPRGPLIIYFLGYGLIAILAIVGIYHIIKNKSKIKYYLVALWGVVNFLAIAIPLSFQRKLIEGAQVPLVILGIIGLIFLFKKFKLKKWTVVSLTSVLIIISSLSIIPILKDYYKPVQAENREIYYSDSEKEAFDWIKTNYDNYPLVLSKDFRGGYLVWKSNVRVYVGHWSETVNFYDDKVVQVESFFRGKMNISDMKDFLRDNQIDLVYIGEGEEFDPPAEFLGIEEVFSNEKITIFENQNLDK